MKKWNGTEVNRKRIELVTICGALRFSSGSGLLTLHPVFVREAKLIRVVKQSIAKRSVKENDTIFMWNYNAKLIIPTTNTATAGVVSQKKSFNNLFH